MVPGLELPPAVVDYFAALCTSASPYQMFHPQWVMADAQLRSTDNVLQLDDRPRLLQPLFVESVNHYVLCTRLEKRNQSGEDHDTAGLRELAGPH
jgi:hypothetical protein